MVSMCDIYGCVKTESAEGRRDQRCVCALVSLMVAIGLLVASAWTVEAADGPPETATDARPIGRAGFINVDGRDLQKVIDEAPPNSTILCDQNQQLTCSVPIRITKPLTLCGLNARLPAKLGSTSLVLVKAKGVTITDFDLTGNGDTVSQDERAPLIAIGAGHFRIERGRFTNGSKDGINITADAGDGQDIVGGVVRDIVGRNVIRDTVSISGSGGKGGLVRNVLVDNVRCYHSIKGCVEVSDGTDNITVRKVYAEDCVYVVDVQDHGQPKQINRNVVLEDIYALRCKHAIRTNNIPIGHANLTVRDITARECTASVRISNTDNVSVYNVRIFDHQGKGPPVYIKNCRGVAVRDVLIENTEHKGPAMLLEDCDTTLIDGLALRGKTDGLTSGICFRICTDRTFSGLRINHVFTPPLVEDGILLEVAEGKKGTLSDYVISENLARITDRIQGSRAVMVDNPR
jgi:hypothetical protein